ncbi:MAG: hypothetical protein ABI782_00715 [Anaerolineaceae bacterium]
MGHRKNRKRQRQSNVWSEPAAKLPEDDWSRPESDADFLFLHGDNIRERGPATSLCGGCREFIEDQEGGRGTCLHPGSGILSPWTDTLACEFFLGQRNAVARRS